MDFFPANFMLQTGQEDDHHQPPISLAPVMPPCTSQDFHGVVPLASGKRSMTFSGFHMCDQEANGGDDELSDDDGSQFGGERKRRLNMEQVRTLEKNFELGNKLEPERKMQLARALGLQPRQIAIWFQNRRARWKTKQLEKDYQILKRQFDAIKADNDALQAHNHKLQSEILALKGKEPTEYSINLNKETEGCCSNRSENSSDLKLDMSRTMPTHDSPSDDLSIHHNPTICKTLFPPPPNIRPTTPSGFAAQLFHNNASRPDLQCLKISNNTDHHHQTVKEESLANMFCSVDDQTAFWPWLEQQQFN